MRRSAPRPLAPAVERAAAAAAPLTPLARVQRSWRAAVGEAVARVAEPVSERAGVVTVACRTAAWAQELALLSAELEGRVNALAAGPEGAAPVRSLRFVTRAGAGAG